jgi:hypothetical protein
VSNSPRPNPPPGQGAVPSLIERYLDRADETRQPKISLDPAICQPLVEQGGVEPIREADEVRFIDLVQHRRGRSLDDFVFESVDGPDSAPYSMGLGEDAEGDGSW